MVLKGKFYFMAFSFFDKKKIYYLCDINFVCVININKMCSIVAIVLKFNVLMIFSLSK